MEGNKKLHNLDGACTWVQSTGDVICSNYAKPPFYGLNPICSYLGLAVKMVCRCQPSISIAKHGRMKKSHCKNHCNSLLRTENIYCPWGNRVVANDSVKCVSTIAEFNMEVDQCNVALDDFCKRLLSFAAAAVAGHDNDERKEINAIQKARIDENCFYDKDDEDEFWIWATKSSAYNSKVKNSSMNVVVALADIIKFADELCVLTNGDYART